MEKWQVYLLLYFESSIFVWKSPLTTVKAQCWNLFHLSNCYSGVFRMFSPGAKQAILKYARQKKRINHGTQGKKKKHGCTAAGAHSSPLPIFSHRALSHIIHNEKELETFGARDLGRSPILDFPHLVSRRAYPAARSADPEKRLQVGR